MNYVVGIVTDGSKILLLRKNNPDWQKGLYNGVGGKVNLDETPLEAIIRECQKEVGLKIPNWNQIETIPLQSGVDLTYFFAVIEEEELKKAQSLQDERVEFFDIDNLPKNILKDLKEQIDNIFLKIESKSHKKIKRIIAYTSIVMVILLLSLMIIGKVAKGNYLYFLVKEKVEEDIDKKAKFKKGFYEKMGITE
ncbi:NUDIX hydrolase [Aliarcobacter butzleri]|uniref:NUDIX hydrolase n=1 Tax=Aliarcobacter butzleri TaxID=28197 RepID=UPI0021B6A35C|nr:NUDIX domain-containing protein [Aliarcobacter butzleri]MCT7588188.1 NUDIX domain-containing protein [Aliarcobacter butzleri]